MRTGRWLRLGVLLGFALLPAPAVHADSVAATDHVRAELVASADAVRPGDSVTLGLQQRIVPGWHTYWQNPGDSGLATTIDWVLPAGATAGEILWPLPQRYSLGPITNYGYADEVTLLAEVSVPTDAKPGDRFPATATVDWLVCAEVCIPEQVTLDLDLPVAAPGAAVGPGSPLIEAARAELPVESPWPAGFERRGESLILTLDAPELTPERVEEAYFYAAAWGELDHAAPQSWVLDDGRLTLTLTPGQVAVPGDAPAGVLVVTERTADGPLARGFALGGGAASAQSAAPVAAASPLADIDLATALAFALLGGLILNLMPCVFPVLSMKALSLLGHARAAPGKVRLHGAAYTLGVLVSFAALAGLLLALKAGGAQIGWGFQFQSPVFVLLVAYVMFAVGLSQSGVFTIGRISGLGSGLAAGGGYGGSFFTGMLATLVATPCTAPFMGAAIGFALAQPPLALFAVFLALGLGLALPYLLLCAWPPLLKLLPKPGPWMLRFKQVMAFPMYGAAAWLVWVLSLQAGADAVAAALGGMVAIAFAAWLYEATRGQARTGRWAGGATALLAAVAAVGLGVTAAERPAVASIEAPGGDDHWEPFSPARLEALRAEGRPVFVNFTAAWCITCLVNERVALNRDEVAAAFAAGDITYLKGDWTNQDPAITAMLAAFGRSGVPLYLFYPAGRDAAPVVLPQILTVEGVLQSLRPEAAAQL